MKGQTYKQNLLSYNELDRISEATTFGRRKLLDGTFQHNLFKLEQKLIKPSIYHLLQPRQEISVLLEWI